MSELNGLALETTQGMGIDVGEQEKKIIMNEIVKDARKTAAKIAREDPSPKGRSTKITQWAEFYANRSRIRMENKTTSFGGCGFMGIPEKRARFIAYGHISEAINSLRGAQLLDQKVVMLTRLGAKLIQGQLLQECNNRYTYIVLHMLAEVYSAKVPHPDDFFTREKTFHLKVIMEQINTMYNQAVV
ncbi:hypothetical protein ACJJIW_11245 [Microbulbifer sp. JMSA004]|uniref:hypothetical protein n=1 Tax=unclassified Microbulbifer TaxID=2619833 RepID=UPI0024ACD2B9|nr:hypothetical protein [Microbulbifer sp. VAAF005]WHI45861.1 hypothetical protein P0078_19395 [Microbulbifer sp. VAAF005]